MQALVVDDDIATVDVIRDSVHWQELDIDNVYTAYNIEQAKEILLQEDISVVISDIEMPQGSGMDLLRWFREQKLEGEFLLLTCHESFQYATDAIKMDVAEYLLKPFDVAVMEAALKKMVFKIQKKHRDMENIRYGVWAKEHKQQLEKDFWGMVLNGESRQRLETENKKRQLGIDLDTKYALVLSKATDLEKDQNRMNQELVRFILENVHAEVLVGNPQTGRVLSFDKNDHLLLACICQKGEHDIKEQCEALQEQLEKLISATVTCCISKEYYITQLHDVFEKNQKLWRDNRSFYGKSFLEEEIVGSEQTTQIILNHELLSTALENKEKITIMSYFKECLSQKVAEKTLNAQMLLQVRQEMLMLSYGYLSKKGIQTVGFFCDETSGSMSEKSTNSLIDMLRFVNYLLEQVYLFEEESQKGHTIIDKINQYIKEHYKENIGKNEIAEAFFLAPDYVAKMYKKQTGVGLKDYISEYQIEQAKILLRNTDMMVSEVASEVGFDNFTYFSTMFKKYTDMTPNQYRKENIS